VAAARGRIVSRVHHHRLVLNGAPAAVARLTDDLLAAGAVAIACCDPPVRLVWATPRASAVEALCARHRGVVVGLERFEALGAEIERLVLHGRDRTLLERRSLAGDDDPYGAPALGEDAVPVPAGALRAAARRVAALPVAVGPGLLATALDDALLLCPALGRLCTAAGDLIADDPPPRAALCEVAELAARGLTVAAAGAGPSCPAELAFERSWRLAGAAARVGREPLWSRPGDADWPEWLMDLLERAAAVIETCAAGLHHPPPPQASVYAEHFCTVDEYRDQAATDLVTAALQTLVLFGGR
jgi:hypothetical protein